MLKKIICFMVGMLIIQTGASLFILTEIGSDPFTVFIQAISYKLHTTPGFSNMIVTLIILIGIFLIDKSYIKIGTVFGMLTAGPCLDLMIHLFGDIPFSQFPYPIRI
ncbi:MAG: YczE/YyaS/YitT family protein, partial [Turicibacter sp.]